MGRGVKQATMEIFPMATLRVELDEAHESAENAPIRIARRSGLGDTVEKSFNQHDSHREICGPVSPAMPVSAFKS